MVWNSLSLFAISKFEDVEFLWKNNRPETLNLEFKGLIDANEVAKDVSSFANGEGGVIIYGVEESKGRAIQSNGIPIRQNSEQVQQIISSSTGPQIPMTIEQIANPNDATKEFLIVKIPKSEYYIHQVTTTGIYHVRANTITTPHHFDPVILGENDIARRYEARFQSRLVAESFVKQKENRIFRDLQFQQWKAGLVLSVVPHVRVPHGTRLTKEDFQSYFANKKRYVTYGEIPSINSVPSIDGRHTPFTSAEKSYLEMNKDRSIFYCRINTQVSRVEIFDPVYMTADLLHLANRFMVRTNHYGGMTFRLHLTGGLSNAQQIPGITLFQSESEFSMEHELPPAPFDLKIEFSRIYDRYFEALHVDSAISQYPAALREIENRWKAHDELAWENSP